ncbi:MAG TPA: hypothetical protein VF814_04665 [Casimicrobiaceae bacterium]
MATTEQEREQRLQAIERENGPIGRRIDEARWMLRVALENEAAGHMVDGAMVHAMISIAASLSALTGQLAELLELEHKRRAAGGAT